jgi:hypothetical protein
MLQNRRAKGRAPKKPREVSKSATKKNLRFCYESEADRSTGTAFVMHKNELEPAVSMSSRFASGAVLRFA